MTWEEAIQLFRPIAGASRVHEAIFAPSILCRRVAQKGDALDFRIEVGLGPAGRIDDWHSLMQIAEGEMIYPSGERVMVIV